MCEIFSSTNWAVRGDSILCVHDDRKVQDLSRQCTNPGSFCASMIFCAQAKYRCLIGDVIGAPRLALAYVVGGNKARVCLPVHRRSSFLAWRIQAFRPGRLGLAIEGVRIVISMLQGSREVHYNRSPHCVGNSWWRKSRRAYHDYSRKEPHVPSRY